MVLAVAHPWASASSYLSSQSFSDSRFNLRARKKERKKTDNPREGWENGDVPIKFFFTMHGRFYRLSA